MLEASKNVFQFMYQVLIITFIILGFIFLILGYFSYGAVLWVISIVMIKSVTILNLA